MSDEMTLREMRAARKVLALAKADPTWTLADRIAALDDAIALREACVTLHVEHDPDVESPCDNDGAWTLYSFHRGHRNYKDPEECGLGGRERNGEVRIINLGLRQRLRVGLAFILSYYEHGRCAWSLSGSGPHCPWDTVDVAGLLVWEHAPGDMGATTLEERRKDAAAFLEEYTAWANGDTYAWRLETEDGNVSDSCGGFIGRDGMWETIREAVGDRMLSFADGGHGSAADLRREYEGAAAKATAT